MTLAEMRSQGRRKRRLPIIEVLSLIILITALGWFGKEYLAYRNRPETLGADVTIAGVQVGGLSEDEREERVESVYLDQPVYLEYNGNPIWLYPAEVGFSLDMAEMQSKAEALGESSSTFWLGFWNHLWRKSQSEIDVKLIATYSDEKLDAYLQDLTYRYDTPTTGPGFDVYTATFNNGLSNTRLDVEQARPLIAAALLETDSEKRKVNLPTLAVESQPITMATLHDALIQYMEVNTIPYNTDKMVISMYVMDLTTGEEMGIQENVPMGAVSTIKIPLMINYFRHKLTEPTDDEKYLLAAAIICSRNSAANELLRISSYGVGDDSYGVGATLLNQTMCDAGVSNTRLGSAIDNGTPEQLRAGGIDPDFYYRAATSTPCPEVGAPLDTTYPNLAATIGGNKTTASDMGNVMGLLYQCAMDGGGLRTIFPDDITQYECQEMFEVLRGTRFERFSELGAPDGTTIHHKVGYGGEWNGDVAIVQSPATDYVFVIYVWDGQQKDENGNRITLISTWDKMDGLSRVVYNYFNTTAPLLQTRPPVNPNGGAACVMPLSLGEVNLTNIDENRFDENGNPLQGACYDYPDCRPFDNWGQTPQQ